MTKMRNTVLLFMVMSIALSTFAVAAYTYVPFDPTKKFFTPNSGSLTVTCDVANSTVDTTLSFQYSSERALSIFSESYNANYATMDIKDHDQYTGFGKLDAYTITTTLPNPKYDIEDGNFDRRCEEAEVVALGGIKPDVNYSMIVTWNDNRSQTSQGKEVAISVNSELSSKGIIDYNAMDYEPCVIKVISDVKGQLS